MKSLFVVAALLTSFVSSASFAAAPTCEFIFAGEDAVIAKIHNQLEVCGTLTCMAHTAATKLENLIYLKTGKTVPLSVPHLIANAARLRFDNKYGVNDGANYGLHFHHKIQTVEQDFIFQAALKYGVVPEADWQPEKLFGPKYDMDLNLKFLREAPFENLAEGRISNVRDLRASFDRRLTEMTGPQPEHVMFEGQSYTPIELAKLLLPEYEYRQVLVEGHENLNREYRPYSKNTITVSMNEALELALKRVDQGEAVPASFSWIGRYRNEGVFKVDGKPQKLFFKEFYHGMVIVNYLRDQQGQVEWLKVANSHGITKEGPKKNFEGYYFIHRSYFEPYLLRLYLFDPQS